MNQQILDINENDWVAFIAQDAFAEYRFVLNDMREKAKEKLPVSKNNSSVDYQPMATMHGVRSMIAWLPE